MSRVCTYMVFFYHVQSPPIIYTDTPHLSSEHMSDCSYRFLHLYVTPQNKTYVCKILLLKCRYQNGA